MAARSEHKSCIRNLKGFTGGVDGDGMHARLLRVLRRLRSDESGQSLVIMGLVMVVVMGVAGISIDAATWDVKHHQDQVVADSAALAAANSLANPNTGQNSVAVPRCTSGTDVADAQKVAVSYAAQNGLTITTGQVSVSGSTVTVNAQSTTPSYFAKVSHIGSASESASATAGFTPATSSGNTLSWGCTSAQESAGSCDAIYAADPGCGTTAGVHAYSITLTVTGGVHSEGAINLSGGTYTFDGPTTYNSGNCTYSSGSSTGATPGSGSKYSPVAGGNEASTFWPADYTKVFTACGTGYAYQCTGPAGTPSYCTISAASFSFADGTMANGIYCAYGTGTPSNPTTWNGEIYLDTWGVTATVTLIGGYIDAPGGGPNNLTPYADQCLMYATGPNVSANSSSALYMANSTYNTTGAMFAPNGAITAQGITLNAGFMEGYDVNVFNGTFTMSGIGPSSGSGATVTSSSGAGTDSLVPTP